VKNKSQIVSISLIVALGGFLMGFDASVISGVVKFLEPEFGLTKIELGWAVSSLTLTATLAMLVAGPLSNVYGRRRILSISALLYAVSALFSAFAPDFITLVIARMIGGFGVGASLILAPMYIAEISPANIRGRMVSFNQLNIVIGISVAFFSNYLILNFGKNPGEWAEFLMLKEHNWRWMLGVEFIPAILYFFALFTVPRSTRWLIMKDRLVEAKEVLTRISPDKNIDDQIKTIKESLHTENEKEKTPFKELFKPTMKKVLGIGIVVAILQQITGINSVFFYAPMIFEQTGIGTDASFSQAILIGIINLIFTIIAIGLIDKIGRRPLLIFGVGAIAVFMFVLSASFSSATYVLDSEAVQELPVEINKAELASIIGVVFNNDVIFKNAIKTSIGTEMANRYEGDIIKRAINANSTLILIGILGFVAAFAISLGPVMWVLFSELFPNRIRGLAISFVGLINSAISFIVQLVFPWEMSTLGSSTTFLIYGVFALLGLFFVALKVPETKGKSLEELEKILIK
jgi:SP family arabinose:H+ symporter-like MFS transporter